LSKYIFFIMIILINKLNKMNDIKRIKKDLLKILILSIIIFGSFLILYYQDQKVNLLEELAKKLMG